MKIHIFYKFTAGVWGGGNQFLHSLRQEFTKLGCYTDAPKEADIIIFNSYHKIFQALLLKIRYPNKIFIHRLGPVFHLHRGEKWKYLDRVLLQIAESVSCIVIFQSRWSYEEALRLGFNPKKRHTIIGNATDNTLFHLTDKTKHVDKKTRIITDCWSVNRKKGFEFYQFLDKHLDFRSYAMTFIGNSPVTFRNITLHPPIPGKDLAEALRQHDIFVSAAADDACSNAIVEALACGLPVVALASGGNSEIIKSGGELFQNKEELLEKITLVRNKYDQYRQNIVTSSIHEIANAYLRSIKEASRRERTNPLSKAKMAMLYWKLALSLLWIKL